MRLGIYSDLVFRRDAEGLSNNRAFIRFVTSLPPRVDEVVLFGRLDPVPGRSPYPVPEQGVRFVPLPYYPRVTSLGGLLAAVRRSCATFAAELERLDAVWLFGPHPLAVLFATIARRAGKPLFLGVRQDYPQYIANRLPRAWWRWAVPVAAGLDAAYRLLALRAPTVVLGSALEDRYRRGARVMSIGFSLVPRAELAPPEEAHGRRWDGPLRLLTVSRLDPEKNPRLLLDVIAGLRARDPRWTLVVAGDGPLRGELEEEAAARGLAEVVDFRGEVPNGPELWTLYRSSHVFLHVSFTEGLPQVLFEAQAAGLPIVATAVGGVADALGGGRSGLLMPPGDARLAVDLVDRLSREPELRRSLVSAALELADRETLEAQLDRIAVFLGAAPDGGARTPAPAGALS